MANSMVNGLDLIQLEVCAAFDLNNKILDNKKPARWPVH